MSKDSSRKDIAKQFDLPERKSKIATLLKQNDEYCICRSTDSTSFMIACDNCEEWYHGHCINITASDAKYIRRYFCPPCSGKNPELEIEYKKPKPTVVKKDLKKSKSESPNKPYKSSKDTPPKHVVEEEPVVEAGCGSCIGCLAVVDCGRCDNCRKSQKYGSRKGRLCRKRECHENKPFVEPVREGFNREVLSERQIVTSSEEDNWIPSAVKPRKQKPIQTKQKQRSTKSTKSSKNQSSRSRRKERNEKKYALSESEKDSDVSEEEEELKQCYGLNCIKAARRGSKYCSDECGINLASERLYRILPPRIQEWNLSTSVAEEHNKRDLDELREKQNETKASLSELERKRAELDEHVENIQRLHVDPNMEDEEAEEDGNMYCISCGMEIAIKSCIKHMERCYNKYESQTSFGSIYKTRLEGTPIFCDFFNPSNGTYCKRLKVLCPEHSKEPKIRDNEVCGCPFGYTFEPSEEFCRLPKKKCNKHFCWEKLRRAEIDMERVRHWLKLDELIEQDRQVRLAISSRAGVMNLLMHSTFDHDLRARIQSQIKEGTPDEAASKSVSQTSGSSSSCDDEEMVSVNDSESNADGTDDDSDEGARKSDIRRREDAQQTSRKSSISKSDRRKESSSSSKTHGHSKSDR